MPRPEETKTINSILGQVCLSGGAVFPPGGGRRGPEGLFSGLEVFFGLERGPHVHECHFKTCEKMCQCLVKYRKMWYTDTGDNF